MGESGAVKAAGEVIYADVLGQCDSNVSVCVMMRLLAASDREADRYAYAKMVDTLVKGDVPFQKARLQREHARICAQLTARKEKIDRAVNHLDNLLRDTKEKLGDERKYLSKRVAMFRRQLKELNKEKAELDKALRELSEWKVRLQGKETDLFELQAKLAEQQKEIEEREATRAAAPIPRPSPPAPQPQPPRPAQSTGAKRTREDDFDADSSDSEGLPANLPGGEVSNFEPDESQDRSTESEGESISGGEVTLDDDDDDTEEEDEVIDETHASFEWSPHPTEPRALQSTPNAWHPETLPEAEDVIKAEAANWKERLVEDRNGKFHCRDMVDPYRAADLMEKGECKSFKEHVWLFKGEGEEACSNEECGPNPKHTRVFCPKMTCSSEDCNVPYDTMVRMYHPAGHLWWRFHSINCPRDHWFPREEKEGSDSASAGVVVVVVAEEEGGPVEERDSEPDIRKARRTTENKRAGLANNAKRAHVDDDDDTGEPASKRRRTPTGDRVQ